MGGELTRRLLQWPGRGSVGAWAVVGVERHEWTDSMEV